MKRAPAFCAHAVGTRHVAEGEALVGRAAPGARSRAGRTGVERRRAARYCADRATSTRRRTTTTASEGPAHRWRLTDALTYSSAVTSEGKSVVSKAQPVPAAPPSAGDVLRHGASVGLRRARPGAPGDRAPRSRRCSRPSGDSPLDVAAPTLDLVPGAVAGLALVAERRVAFGRGRRRRPAPRPPRAVGDAARGRAARAAAARGPALELERGRAARAGPQPGRGRGGPPDDRAAGHRERDRAARLRAHRRADPDRRHRRPDRHRRHRATASTSAA